MQRNKQRRTVSRHREQAVQKIHYKNIPAHGFGQYSMYETAVDIDVAGENGEGDEGIHQGQTSGQLAVDELETNEESASIGGEGHSGSPSHFSATAIGQQGGIPSEDAVMTDASSSDGSTPWLDYLRSLDSPSNPTLPFGLYFDNTLPGADQDGQNPNLDNADAPGDNGGGAALDYQDSESDAEQHHTEEHTEDSMQSHNVNLLHIDTQVHSAISFNDQPEPAFTDDFLDFIGNTALASTGLPFGFIGDYTAPNAWGSPSNASDEPETESMPGQPIDPHSPAFLDDDMPPIVPSTVSMGLGCYNVGLVNFLRLWAHRGEAGSRKSQPPDIREVRKLVEQTPDEVTYNDLKGDQCDFQGINWEDMGTTRTAARARRQLSYRNYVNRAGSDRWMPQRKDVWVPPTASFLRFRRMKMFPDVSIRHFQLRSSLSCASRSQIFYTTPSGVKRFNPISNKVDLALSNGQHPGEDQRFTTIDAKHGLLVGGTFSGKVMMQPLYSESRRPFTQDISSGEVPSITNHIQIYTPRRSSSPLLAICGNDQWFKVLDLQTEQFLFDSWYPFAINCSATSPDRRLRALVGDTRSVYITNAETGCLELSLGGHADYGFACDWSPDGRTVATGFQDKSVKIWDSRKWVNSKKEPTPVASFWCDMAGARSLRFSPAGSGPSVLVAAEEADYVTIIDAKTFDKKQTIDVFGEIGGVDFTNEGSELNVLVSDAHRGGLVQLERCQASAGFHRPAILEQLQPF